MMEDDSTRALQSFAPIDPIQPIESPPQAAPSVDLRSKMIAQFEQWLDEMLADEPPPRGVPEHLLNEAIAHSNGSAGEQATDLFSLFSALTKLTGEIGLQGRAFKQLTDLLSPLSRTPAMLEELQKAHAESAEAIESLTAGQTEESGAVEVPFRQVCEVMIDLFDRLQRGLQTCDEGIESLQSRGQTGWLHRLRGDRAGADRMIGSVQAIRDAGAMTLARLSAALQEWSVQRVGRIGEPFDPDRMTAVDVRVDSQTEPGTVVVVNRSGYAINGNLKATAQVTVSKA